MSKPIYQVTHCEKCDKILKYGDSLPQESYESGQVHARNLTILLPRAVQRRHVRGGSSFGISGIFCTVKCFIDYIDEDVMKIKERGLMLSDELGLPTAEAVELYDEDGDHDYDDEDEDLPF